MSETPLPPDVRRRWLAVRQKAEKPGQPHGDQWPALTIQGLDWFIPPRGQRVVPAFDDGGICTVSVSDACDWPEMEAFLAAVTVEGAACEKCGQPLPDTDHNADLRLQEMFALARRVLSERYDLDKVPLAELLEFDMADPPPWPAELHRWALGLPKPDPMAELDAMLAAEPEPDVEPEVEPEGE